MRSAEIKRCSSFPRSPNRAGQESGLRIDSVENRVICLKGFEDGWLRPSVCDHRLSEAPAQCGSERIFDNKVERASREKSFEFKFERSHKLNNSPLCLRAQRLFIDLRR